MIKTRVWMAIILIILIISGATSIYLFTMQSSGTVAKVYLDGECIYSINLNEVTDNLVKEITTPNGGRNVIEVQPGGIRISDADCPDQVCVQMGWIHNSAAPIVCLPHRLVIRVEKGAEAGKDDFDSVVK